jgi:hypothetical protein
MDPIELSALGGMGSALLAAVSYWAKTTHERRRVTRTVLFYLLELHHHVSRTLIAVTIIDQVLLSEFRTALAAKGLTLNEAEGEVALTLAMPIFEKFGLEEIKSAVTETAAAYEKALADLARENPILAFRLRGRDQAALLGNRMRGFVSVAGAVPSGQPQPLAAEIAQFDRMFLKLSAEELRNAIRATAWGCDLLTHIKVWFLIRASEKESDSSPELRQVVRRLVEEYVSRMPAP